LCCQIKENLFYTRESRHTIPGLSLVLNLFTQEKG
jgi:hypothetical protein